jgi:hypothetical protein
MVRNHWVAIIDMDALRQPDLKELIRNSYQLVLEKLPKKTQAGLRTTAHTTTPTAPARKKTRTKPRAKGQ